jgi:DNA-binding winged helix-turn-helix (wHTH) protein
MDDWVVEPQLNQLVRKERVCRLEPQAMDVLSHLLEEPGRVVSIQELLETYWRDRAAAPSMVAKRISQIRHSLGDDARRPKYIETIPKRGYRVVAQVSRREATHDHDEISTRKRSIRSLAVLPLVNLTADLVDDKIAIGICAELIAELASMAWLDVASLTSSTHHSLTKLSLPEIAEQLEVDCIVEGSVTHEAGHYRINIQLIDVHSDKSVWSHKFDEEDSSALSVRSAVTNTVVSFFKAEHLPEREQAARTTATQT